MASASLKWDVSPAQLARNLQDRLQSVPDAVHEVGVNGASRWASTAKQIAPWQDRTTAARGGLTGEAHRQGQNTEIVCFHTVEYGPYLEVGTSKMAARPSIMPAMMIVGPGIVEDAVNVVNELLS